MDHPTWLNTDLSQNDDQLPFIKQWSTLKLFYRQHMPYARLAQKESVAVIYHSNVKQTDMFPSCVPIGEQQIMAAIRLRNVGKYQLICGLLVHPKYRGQQLSTQLLKFITPKLLVGNCFLFANPELIKLYQRHHFMPISPSELSKQPADITQLYRRYHSKQRPLVMMQLCKGINKNTKSNPTLVTPI